MDKRKKNYFLKSLLVVFIIYLTIFIASESGYYEKRINQDVIFTSEAIKQFEKDVSEGKNVNINTYLIKDNKNYANVFTKSGEIFSKIVENVLTDGVSDVIDVFKTLFM